MKTRVYTILTILLATAAAWVLLACEARGAPPETTSGTPAGVALHCAMLRKYESGDSAGASVCIGGGHVYTCVTTYSDNHTECAEARGDLPLVDQHRAQAEDPAASVIP